MVGLGLVGGGGGGGGWWLGRWWVWWLGLGSVAWKMVGLGSVAGGWWWVVRWLGRWWVRFGGCDSMTGGGGWVQLEVGVCQVWWGGWGWGIVGVAVNGFASDGVSGGCELCLWVACRVCALSRDEEEMKKERFGAGFFV